MNTIPRPTYDRLLTEAKGKANALDTDVAIVIWGAKDDGTVNSKIVQCHRRYTGNDMTNVNKLLDEHKDAEILEIVGSNA